MNRTGKAAKECSDAALKRANTGPLREWVVGKYAKRVATGFTDDELFVAYKEVSGTEAQNSIRPARIKLCKQGILVEKTDRNGETVKRTTRQARDATVYVLAEDYKNRLA